MPQFPAPIPRLARPEPVRPSGLVERWPLKEPPAPAAYAPADGAPAAGDRRRRRRGRGEPWRGRLVDLEG